MKNNHFSKDQNPKHLEFRNLLQKAKEFFQQNNFKSAMDYALKAVEKSPENSKVINLIEAINNQVASLQDDSNPEPAN